MNGRRVGSESAAEELKHSESIGIRYGWEFVIEFHSDTIIANGSGFVNREIRRKATNTTPPHNHSQQTQHRNRHNKHTAESENVSQKYWAKKE